MDLLQSTQLDAAIALQTLALPCTLILCIISMLRERSIGHQDEKRLVRLYKQHAFAFELVQYFVSLMACGFVAGNMVASFEARSLVIGFASEDVTAMIVRSALSRNVWLFGSALCILACMSMLDSWSLPNSLQDLTDPLFRLTRELIRSYIWRHDHEEDHAYHDKPLSYDVEQPRPPPKATSIVKTEAPEPSSKITPPVEAPQTPNPETSPSPSTTSPPSPTESSYFPNLPTPPAEPQPQTPPPTNTHPPASHPRYQNQTLISALRASSKSPKSRSRKRSVTFALQPEPRDGAKQSKRERSSVREKAQELEKMVCKGNEKEATKEDEEWEQLSSSGSSKESTESEDSELAKVGGELGVVKVDESSLGGEH